MNTEPKPSRKARVVLDTNVIVSGLNFLGNELRVLELVREGKIDTYLSPFIF